MKMHFHLLLGLLAVLGPGPAARAQDTNWFILPPQTRLEGFETNTGAIIIKGSAPIGTVSSGNAMVSVKCRVCTDTGSGRRESGVVLGISEDGQVEDDALVDYDELDPLVSALDYLVRVDWSVTPLPGFDAVFTTKGGFRVVAFGSRRNGTIEFAVRNLRTGKPPVRLARDQVSLLRSLVEQARTKLDSVRQQK